MSGPETDNAVFVAAMELQAFCTERQWPFCFIGGLAVARWAVPRFTEDADMTLLTRFLHDEEYATALLTRFAARRAEPLEFALRNRVIPLRHENGVEMDVALGALDFEDRAIQRATWWKTKGGGRLFTCSAEDLVVHKAFASRDQDWLDVESVMTTQQHNLNCAQILDELRPLAELKEDVAIVPKLEQMIRRRGLGV